MFPAILTFLALVLVTVIVVFLFTWFRAFLSFYTSFGAERELPLVTRIIVGISNFVRGQDCLLLIITVPLVVRSELISWIPPACPGGGAVRSRRAGRADAGRRGAGISPRRRCRGRWPRCSGGGLPLVRALGITSQSMANQYMAKTTRHRHRASQKKGNAFSKALQAREVFPEVAVRDGRSRRVHGGASGDAEYGGRLSRRGSQTPRWSGS